MIKRAGGGGWAQWIVMWGFVAAAVFVGVKGLTEGLPKAPDYGPVYCDDEVMGSGDRCNLVSGGAVRNSNSYEKLREQQEAGRGAEPVLLVIGSVLILGGVGGGFLLIRAIRRHRS
jgi:hypothetical protein